MFRLPPRSTRTDTLCPNATLFRSAPRLLPPTGYGPLTSAPAGELLDLIAVIAADALFAAVIEAGDPMAHRVPHEAGDRIAAQDRRAVDADEQLRIQLLLQLADHPIDEPGALADVQAHIVSLRSEERRVGKGCVSTGRSRGSP